MQLAYGLYTFPVNGTEVGTSARFLYNAGNQPKSILAEMHVRGYLTSTATDPQADLSLKMGALATAMAIPYQDLILFQDDGLQSATKLLNLGAITGVRIVDGINFPRSDRGEYATQRYFEFRAEAEYPLVGALLLLESWTETLTTWGGAPEIAYRRALNGPPQMQLVWPFTEGYATQRGEIVGYLGYPNGGLPPAPIFPQALMKAPRVTLKSPKRMGRGYQDFAIEYEYEFVAGAPLLGVPSLWP